MMPVTCGAAIDVPEMVSACPPGLKPDASGVRQLPEVQVTPLWVEVIFNPGAVISGLSAAVAFPRLRRGPREVKEVRVSAAVAADSVPFAGRLATMVFRSASEIITVGMLTWVLPEPPMPPNVG